MTVGILGFGWLGRAAAHALLNKNIKVKASKTKWPKGSGGVGVEPFALCITEKTIVGDLTFFDAVNQLLIFLPPSQNNTGFSLLSVLEVLFKHITKTDIKRVIFTSSTSVYGPQSGIITENTQVAPHTKNAKVLVQCEQFIQKQNLPSLIFRLGGLVGSNRNPINQLQHKKISNPEGVINFIDQTDAVRVLIKALENETLSGVYNAVCPHHPTRRAYYIMQAKKRRLPTPQFAQEPALKRIISSEKLQHDFNYVFEVDNLLI